MDAGDSRRQLMLVTGTCAPTRPASRASVTF